jgi:hypothetical protein
VCISQLFHVCYRPCPFHPPSFEHSDIVWWRVQIMMLLIVQFCPASCNFPPSYSTYSPQHLNLKLLNLCSSLRVGDQVSHLYKTTGKLQFFVYFNIQVFRQEDKRFWTKLYQIFPELKLFFIYSWMKFWFVTVISIY